MAENYDSFLDIVKGSDTVRQRWADVVERTVTDAAKQGVTLTENDVLGMRSARTTALGAPLDAEAYSAELMALPQLSDAAMKAAIAFGDEEARAAALASLNKAEDVPAYRGAGHAADRLSKARELGIESSAPNAFTPELTRDQQLEAISQISHPATRMAMARKWGLI